MQESKQCAECAATFYPTTGRSRKQWDRQAFCTAICANTARARGRPRKTGDISRAALGSKGAYQLEWQRRKALPHWATWWEQQRAQEDLAELAYVPVVYGRGAQPIARRPCSRSFVAGICPACRTAWLYFAKRAQSSYCAECAAIRRKRPGAWRAKQHGAIREPIIPRLVFERDRWRCQLCKRKTRGQVPALRAPTLDHIVPLARGGDHTYANLQCACYECNCFVKRDGAMNDQLRLVG